MNDPQYLLRFDDICPGMNWSLWREIESILVERRLKPILAVVPDNQDPTLQVDAPVENFWERVREWQDRGWTIALHGFQHRYVSRNAGLVATRKKSEFAGLPAAEQREKLRRGMEIFDRERINSGTWIAPGNAFDATTVALLPEFGIDLISAGYFQFPYVCGEGMTWLPQQMHYFRPAPAGVWTVCYHHSQWTASRLETFREEIDRYGANIVSLEGVLHQYARRQSRWSAWLCMRPRLSQFLIRLELKLWSLCRGSPKTELRTAEVCAG